MTVLKHSVHTNRYFGSSTDTKPTTENNHIDASIVPVGSTFYEYDTGLLYVTYDGTNWACKDLSVLGICKTVSVTKPVAAAGNYTALDVISEHATTGTSWLFSAIARANGAYFLISKIKILIETSSQVQRLAMQLYNALPTCNLNDNVANTGVVAADTAKWQGTVIMPALMDIGGYSETTLVPGTYPGSLPLLFKCGSSADDIYGVLVTLDDFTNETATDDYIIEISGFQL
jgi:hypothetical protein